MKVHQNLAYYESLGYLNQETLFDALYKQVQKKPDQLAVVDKSSRLSYRELFNRIKNYAGLLGDAGLERGDRLMLQLPNSIDFISLLFASNMLGAEPVLMLPTHRQSEVITIAEKLNPKVYIGTVDYLGFDYCKMVADNIAFMPSLKTIIGDSDSNYKNINYMTLNNYTAMNNAENKKVNQSERHVGVYLLSGGTTSLPKIIPKINEAYVYNALKAAERCQFNDNTVYLAVLSVAHDYPLANPGVLGVLFSGGTVVFSHTTSFDEAFRWIEQEKVNTTSIVPAVANVWSENYEWFPADLSSLQHMIIGAAKIDVERLSALEKQLNLTIQQGYGLGEGITCFTRLDDPLEIRLGTQGKPISKGDDIKIINPLGKEQPNNQLGEIAEKGPYTFLGYYDNEELNRKVFTEEGYFLTGDLGYLDDDGNLVISGRVDEQINRLGENVIPSEIESILLSHETINNCAVFGMEDHTLGQKTCVCIEGAEQTITYQEILNHFENQGVARFKFPDEIYFLDKLPYSNIGKVDKKKLITMFSGD